MLKFARLLFGFVLVISANFDSFLELCTASAAIIIDDAIDPQQKSDDYDGHQETETDILKESFSAPCPYPCRNFTAAFMAGASGIYFSIDKVKQIANANGSEVALRIEITHYCRFDFVGNFESDHIVVTADELEYTITPKEGRDYVAAVIPSDIARAFRLVTPLVPATEHYPWKHLCHSCGIDAASKLVLETYDDERQNVCTCPTEKATADNCTDVTIDGGNVDISWAHANAGMLVGTVIGSVAAGFLSVVIIVGVLWWRWRKYKEKVHLDRSVLARTRGAALVHPGSLDPNAVAANNNVSRSPELVNDIVQERYVHGVAANNGGMMTFDAIEVTRRQSLTPLLFDHDDSPQLIRKATNPGSSAHL